MTFLIPKYQKGDVVYVDCKNGLSEIRIMKIAFDADKQEFCYGYIFYEDTAEYFYEEDILTRDEAKKIALKRLPKEVNFLRK
jgi:uncharacterized membrane protein YkoI